MIIPPDSEKDPNFFSASSSTPSLALAPSEFDDTTSRWDGDSESLPPYEGRRRSSRVSVLSVSDDGQGGENRHGGEGDVFADRNAAPLSYAATERHRRQREQHGRERGTPSTPLPGLIIPDPTHPSRTQRDRSSPVASSSSAGSLTPTISRPSVSLPRFHSPPTTLNQSSSNEASTSKLWEISSSTAIASGSGKSRSKGKRVCGTLPPPPEGFRRWWKRWRRWALAVMVLVAIGIGLAVGLLVRTKQQSKQASEQKYGKIPPWMDQDTDGKRVATWAGNGSFNLTYSDSRDGPNASQGNLTDCNPFSIFNFSSTPFASLFTPFPYSTLSLASFSFPLSASGLPPSELFISTSGLGSSGTTTFVGLDSAEKLITSGVEGKILIDVIVRYSGAQELGDMMRVCKMTGGETAVGVGIYSPKETDGKMRNPYKLNPALVPTSHVIIRLPPSLYSRSNPALYMPTFTVSADRMIVNIGNLSEVVAFGDLNLDLRYGTVHVGHAEAERTSVVALSGDVTGKWNVSESLIVNVTTGSIATDIVLFDPATFDNSSVLPPTTDYTVVSRSPLPYASNNSDDTETDDTGADDDDDTAFEHEIHSLFNSTSSSNDTTIASASRKITTNIFTEEGSVDVNYLHHPPTVELAAIIATQEGNLDAHFHPTYVGPFLAKTTWGEVNIIPPRPINDFDPFQKGRKRSLIISPIQIEDGSPFSTVGYNSTILECSTDTVSGVIYWALKNENGTQSVEQVQQSKEAQGNSIVVLGGWGDVGVSFDRA